MDPLRVREIALNAALELERTRGDPKGRAERVRDDAVIFDAWLRGTTSLRLIEGPVVDQATGEPTGTTHIPGEIMQLHDNEKFTVTVDTKDAKGFETPDTIAWTSDDNGAVVTLTPAADGKSCEVGAVAPGAATITVTDTSVTPALTATEAVDVVPAGTATITLTEGAVSPE